MPIEQILIKKGCTRSGEIFDIMVQSTSPEIEHSKNRQLKTQEALFHARGIRTQSGMKMHFPQPIGTIQVTHKIYTVLKSKEKKLSDKLNINNQTLSPTQKKILSLRVCLVIKQLHEKRNIIHKNIQANTFMAKIDGHYIALQTFNYQTSNGFHLGTPGFISHEIFYHKNYSFSSDIFSLAIMLLFQCDVTTTNLHFLHFHHYINSVVSSFSKRKWLDPIAWMNHQNIVIEPELKDILFGMLGTNPFLRTSINHLIKYLCEQLVQDMNIETDLRQEFSQYLGDLKPPPTLIFSPFQIKDLFAEARKNIFIAAESKESFTNTDTRKNTL